MVHRVIPLEREVQAGADHVALVGLAAEVHVVEQRAAQVLRARRRRSPGLEERPAQFGGGWLVLAGGGV